MTPSSSSIGTGGSRAECVRVRVPQTSISGTNLRKWGVSASAIAVGSGKAPVGPEARANERASWPRFTRIKPIGTARRLGRARPSMSPVRVASSPGPMGSGVRTTAVRPSARPLGCGPPPSGGNRASTLEATALEESADVCRREGQVNRLPDDRHHAQTPPEEGHPVQADASPVVAEDIQGRRSILLPDLGNGARRLHDRVDEREEVLFEHARSGHLIRLSDVWRYVSVWVRSARPPPGGQSINRSGPVPDIPCAAPGRLWGARTWARSYRRNRSMSTDLTHSGRSSTGARECWSRR